jgi:hypothetical protein
VFSDNNGLPNLIVVRDLVMMGNAEANRRTETVKLDSKTEDEAARLLVNFCLSHVVYRELLKEKGESSVFSTEEMSAIARRFLRLPSPSDFLVEEYRRRLQRWFLAVGVMFEEGGGFRLQPRVTHTTILNNVPSSRRARTAKFLGEAPPTKALEALRDAVREPTNREQLERIHGRNAVSALINLGVLSASGSLQEYEAASSDPEGHLRMKASAQPTVQYVTEILRTGRPRTEVVGEMLETKFGYQSWSIATRQRYGSAVSVWARWSNPSLQFD